VGSERLAELLRQRISNRYEEMRRTVWPSAGGTPNEGTAVVTVNHNTCQLISFLVFSLCRVLPPGQVREIVVVDNKSTDDSLAFLRALHDAGVVSLVRSRVSPYHGPGLNRGLSFVARRQRRDHIRFVWVLDSDAIVLRHDTLTHAQEVMGHSAAALLGQDGHVASLMIDPAQVWQRSVPPFRRHGEPANAMRRSLRDRRAILADFPFFESEYVLHLGTGTLQQVAARGERRNPLFAWALENRTHHYHGSPRGAERLAVFRQWFDAEVGSFTPENLVSSCLRVGGMPPELAGDIR